MYPQPDFKYSTLHWFHAIGEKQPSRICRTIVEICSGKIINHPKVTHAYYFAIYLRYGKQYLQVNVIGYLPPVHLHWKASS